AREDGKDDADGGEGNPADDEGREAVPPVSRCSRHRASFLRIRSTTRSARRLSMKVIVKRTAPTRKSDSYQSPSFGTEPSSAAMLAVIVRTLTKGLSVTCAAFPVAISTIIVSPRARPTPRMRAAVRPETAAGRTTRTIVSQ